MAARLPISSASVSVNMLRPEDEGDDLPRRLLREAIDESGEKHEVVAYAMGVKAPRLSEMLSGQRALTAKKLRALPDDIERRFVAKWAEAHGLIVVTPLEGPAAVKAFVAGMVGMFASGLPAKASGMAKATLVDDARRTA